MMRILQWWKNVKIHEGVIFHLVPPQTYEEAGAETFNKIVSEVRDAGFSYRITERTERELEIRP